MDFEEDKKAYEDYLELMGRNGEHEANSRYNEYEDGRKRRVSRRAAAT